MACLFFLFIFVYNSNFTVQHSATYCVHIEQTKSMINKEMYSPVQLNSDIWLSGYLSTDEISIPYNFIESTNHWFVANEDGVATVDDVDPNSPCDRYKGCDWCNTSKRHVDKCTLYYSVSQRCQSFKSRPCSSFDTYTPYQNCKSLLASAHTRNLDSKW
jgi:hypothetical protein